MSSTPNLSLPLVMPAQAQKHVTVNESLVRLDGLSQLTLLSRQLTTPPAVVIDGTCYGVPAGAVNAWSGRDGQVAIGSNGGWDFASPRAGWRAFVVDDGAVATHDGTDWRPERVTLSTSGAGARFGVIEFDFALLSGVQLATPSVIPPDSVVFGVSGRVVETITGTLSDWSLGNPGAVGRYGTGLGLAAGSFVRGVLSQPTAFYGATALQLDATGGSFSGGLVRLAVHVLRIELPAA